MTDEDRAQRRELIAKCASNPSRIAVRQRVRKVVEDRPLSSIGADDDVNAPSAEYRQHGTEAKAREEIRERALLRRKMRKLERERNLPDPRDAEWQEAVQARRDVDAVVERLDDGEMFDTDTGLFER